MPALFFLSISTLLGLSTILVFSAQRYAAVGSDFTADYAAVRSALAGGPIYGPEIVSLQHDYGLAEVIANNHPPTSAIFFLPIAGFGPAAAFFIFNSISLLLFLLSIAAVLQREAVDPKKRFLLLLFFLIWPPTYGSLALGQSSLLIGALVLTAWNLFCRGSDLRSGVMTGAAGLIKLFPIMLAVFFVCRAKWRALAGVAAAVMAGAAASVWLVGVDSFREYILTVLPYHHAESRMIPFNFSIAGMILPIFQSGPWSTPLAELPRLGAGLTAALQIFVGAATFYTVIAGSRSAGPNMRPGNRELFSIVILAALLISPMTWGHYLLLAVLPFLSFELSGQRRLQTIGRFCLLLIIGASLFPIQNWTVDGKLIWYQSIPIKLSGAGLLLMWLALVRQSLNPGKSTPGADLPV